MIVAEPTLRWSHAAGGRHSRCLVLAGDERSHVDGPGVRGEPWEAILTSSVACLGRGQ